MCPVPEASQFTLSFLTHPSVLISLVGGPGRVPDTGLLACWLALTGSTEDTVGCLLPFSLAGALWNL